MGQQTKLNRAFYNNTTLELTTNDIIVRFYRTAIVTWSKKRGGRIILNSGGWTTATTKTRMNQVANQYNLGYHVYQEKHEWYVDWKGEKLPFFDGITLK